MAEYIEREKAKLCIFEYGVRHRDNSSISYACENLERRMNYIPAANVRPVVRGTWVGIDDFPHEDWECDHCGCVVENTDDPWNYFHYCPNCGADMREES